MEEFDIDDDLFEERPWIKWESTYDVEAWIDHYNRDMKRLVKDPRATGYGICFILEPGGEIFLHTTPEGEMLIDVPEEAEWIAPLLEKVTGSEPPTAQIWVMPVESLTQLIFGISSLTKATRMVVNHDFRMKKRYF
jgi:hypothetical protein